MKNTCSKGIVIISVIGGAINLVADNAILVCTEDRSMCHSCRKA